MQWPSSLRAVLGVWLGGLLFCVAAAAFERAPVLFRPIAEPEAGDLRYVVDADSREQTLPPHVRVLQVNLPLSSLSLPAEQLENVESILIERGPPFSPAISDDLSRLLLSAPNTRQLHFMGARACRGPELKAISELKELQELAIVSALSKDEDWVADHEVDFSVLAKCGKLTRLAIGVGRSAPTERMRQLSMIRGLEVLHLRGSITPAGLAYLARLPNLRILCLENCWVQDEALELISEFFSLTDVSLVRRDGFTDDGGFTSKGVRSLLRMKTLTGLDVRGYDVDFPGTQDFRFEGIKQLVRLAICAQPKMPFPAVPPERLFLRHDPHVLNELKNLPNLRALWFENVNTARYEKSYSAWSHLKFMTQLEFLSLKGCGPLDTYAAEALLELTNLKRLDLTSCVVPKELAAGIQKLANLEHLSVHLHSAQDEGFRLLAKLGELKQLHELHVFGYPGRTTIHLDDLLSLTNLKTLHIRNFELTGLPVGPEVAKSSGIVDLLLVRCTGLKVEHVDALTQLPSLRFLDLTLTLKGVDARSVRHDLKERPVSVIWN